MLEDTQKTLIISNMDEAGSEMECALQSSRRHWTKYSTEIDNISRMITNLSCKMEMDEDYSA